MISELYTIAEAALWAKVSESTLNKLRLAGRGPRFVRVGRQIRYKVEDLEAWINQSAERAPADAQG